MNAEIRGHLRESVLSFHYLAGRLCTLRCFFGSNLFVCLDRGSHCFTEVWLKAMIPLSQSPKHQDCSTTHFHASTVENASQPHCGVRGLWEQQRGTHVREPGLWSCVNRRQTDETRCLPTETCGSMCLVSKQNQRGLQEPSPSFLLGQGSIFAYLMSREVLLEHH